MSDTTRPGDLGVAVLAPLYADGMPLTGLGQVLSASPGASGASRFWSTPPRAATDATREVLEVSLGAARTLNTVSVQIPHFPHTSWLQAYDDNAAAWVTLTTPGGSPAQVSVTDSLPPVIASGVNAAGRRHPQHFGSGHWIPVRLDVTPTTCSRLRLVQTRNPTSATPTGPTGRPVAYSLGARDLISGFSTSVPGSAPLRTGPLAVTADILGSALTHTVRRADPWGLPTGRIWRSAPAPVPTAVVSLYIDCRDALGDPQVIDRLSLDPITSGVSMAVYYSRTAAPAPDFPAADDPLGAVTVPSPANPAVTPGTPGTLVFTGSSCYLDIAANAVGYDPGAPFAWGLTFTPAYPSTDPGPYTVLDTGDFTLTYAAGTFTATLGSLTATVPITFTAGTPLTIGALFDGTSLTLTIPGSAATASSGAPPATARTASIRIGGSLGSTAHSGPMTLASLIAWQCSAPVAAAGLDAYLNDPASVTVLPQFASGPHPSDGTVLRLDPARAGDDSPFGTFGGPGIDVASVVWNPLARDAVARAGNLPLPPMFASLVKVEFTNLAAAPFEVAEPVPASVAIAEAGRSAVAADTSPGSAEAGTSVTAKIGGDFYSDMRRLPGAAGQAVSPTEALYAPDPRVAARIDSAPGFGFTPWQMRGQALAPRAAGTHADAPVDLALTRRAAFFVALRKIALGRDAAGTAPRDYERIVESFHDGQLLAPMDGVGGWESSPGWIRTPPSTAGRRTATSVTLLTHHPVVAVQFAAAASQASQILADADFTAADLSAWTAIGDAALAPGTGYASAIGHAVQVTRGTGAVGGIASAQSFTPGHTGRLHAAVRAYAPSALSAPLELELVNGDGTVLARSSATVSAGQVVQFSASLDLDVPLDPGVNTWGTFNGVDTWSSMAARGTWAQVSGIAVWVHDVTVRLTQSGVDADTFFLDSLAMFSDPITWEVSRDGGASWSRVTDIRNNPAGVLVFGPLTGDGTLLAWRASCDAPGVSITAVALRPWYELRAGGVRPLGVDAPSGPLLSPTDHYGPIEDDPMWQTWSNPVPKGWWTAGRAGR